MILYQPRGKAKEYSEWAINLYRGCEHGCVYCYVPRILRCTLEQFCSKDFIQVRKDVLKLLEKDCKKLQGKMKSNVLLSFTSDPYQKLEEKEQVTRQAMKILDKYGFKITILTKGGELAIRDFDILRKNKENKFGVTMTFIDNKKSKEYEPGAASPDERIASLKEAKKQGIKTWISLEPCIEPEQSKAIIHKTHEYTDLYRVGKLNHVKDAKLIDWSKYLGEETEILKRYRTKYIIKDDLLKLA